MEPWVDLSGKVVMVTGASSGIGHDICLDLAKAGCRVVAAARRVDRLQSLCDDINRLNFPSSKPQPSGPRAVPVELDVSADGATVQRSVKTAWDAFGRIDALINNAGVRGSSFDNIFSFFLIVFLLFHVNRHTKGSSLIIYKERSQFGSNFFT